MRQRKTELNNVNNNKKKFPVPELTFLCYQRKPINYGAQNSKSADFYSKKKRNLRCE